MAVLVRDGRTAIAVAIAQRPIHLAWGTGDGAWDDKNVPDESISASGLIHEIGRRVLLDGGYDFCTPDPAGDIVTPDGRFSVSPVETNYLHLTFKFDFDDAAGQTIREVAVFTETEVVDGLPPGLRYFVPAQLKSPGKMLVVENTVPLVRTSATRESFEFVIPF